MKSSKLFSSAILAMAFMFLSGCGENNELVELKSQVESLKTDKTMAEGRASVLSDQVTSLSHDLGQVRAANLALANKVHDLEISLQDERDAKLRERAAKWRAKSEVVGAQKTAKSAVDQAAKHAKPPTKVAKKN